MICSYVNDRFMPVPEGPDSTSVTKAFQGHDSRQPMLERERNSLAAQPVCTTSCVG